MDYISVKEAASKWNIDSSRVSRLAREGRIEGAIIVARNWLIPKNAKKPEDHRTKNAKSKIKSKTKKDDFHFPLYADYNENAFTPALNSEEKILRKAQLDFLSCNFDVAEEKLKRLYKTCEIIHLRIMSLFFLCLISVIKNNGKDYDSYFLRFEMELSEDFPHKKEMELLRPWLYTSLVQYVNASECYSFDDNYDYEPSVYPLLVYLSFLDARFLNNFNALSMRMDLYKMQARQLENSGKHFEALLLHAEIFIFYFIEGNEGMNYHLKKAIDLASSHNFIYPIADMYPYYTAVIDDVLADYPAEFSDKVKECGINMGRSFSEFSKKHKEGSIFSVLSNADIQYILFALRGLSYKQVADSLNVSERTVANRYAVIYEKLDLNNKKDFLKIISNSLS